MVVLSAVHNVLAAEMIVARVPLGIEDVFMVFIQMEQARLEAAGNGGPAR